MCIPSLEYSFANFPAHIKFGGTLPPNPLNPDFQFPEWFQRITENSAKRASISPTTTRQKIVVTVQGTLAVNYNDIIIPTIKGLASRDDIIVVAILGIRGATLDKEFPDGLPENTIVADYFPYGVYFLMPIFTTVSAI